MFIALVRVAEEKPAVRKKLLGILSHPPVRRGAVLRFYIEGMHRKGAPENFVSAVACLLEDAVADRALALLHSEEESTTTGRSRSGGSGARIDSAANSGRSPSR